MNVVANLYALASTETVIHRLINSPASPVISYPHGYPQILVDNSSKINFSCESRACRAFDLTFYLSTDTDSIHRVIHSLWITRDISRVMLNDYKREFLKLELTFPKSLFLKWYIWINENSGGLLFRPPLFAFSYRFSPLDG